MPGIEAEYLTPGIPGGRLHASLIRLKPGDSALELPPIEGEEGAFVARGTVDYKVEGKVYSLSEGDAIHHATDEPREIVATGSDPVELIVVSTTRLRNEDNGA